MALIADFLMAAGAFAAAVYCLVLSRRLQRLTRLEDGVGGAIAVLSAQVDDMTQALKQARAAAQNSEATLITQTARAELAAERLSLMLAAMHDLPEQQAEPAAGPERRAASDPAPNAVPNVEAGGPQDEPERRVRFLRRRPVVAIRKAAE